MGDGGYEKIPRKSYETIPKLHRDVHVWLMTEDQEDRKVPLDSHNKDLEEDVGDEEIGDHVRKLARWNNAEHCGFVNRIMRNLESNRGTGVRIDVLDISGHMHPKDYLDWEASVDNYFKWKPMEERCKAIFG